MLCPFDECAIEAFLKREVIKIRDEKLCIPPEMSVGEAISVLVDGGKRVIFIVDSDHRLLGLMTNGDMRRYLLTGQPMTLSVARAMNAHPHVFHTQADALASRERNEYIVYPIVDRSGVLVDALFPDQKEKPHILNNDLEDVPLVIMAGGKGTRLYPYTKILPKAIMPIGRYSITERIIQAFHQYGCHQVYMVLNHRASLIKAYLSEVETHCQIDYVQETAFSGTAGGLLLLRDRLQRTFILSNCDILINDDLACAYKTHVAQKNQITFVCSLQNLTVPYGVIETTSEGQIRTITEKPQYSFLANTGVYILEPEVLQQIQDGEFIHITDLTERCIAAGMRAGVFPVSNKAWLDMGQIEEMERMIKELDPE